MKRRTNPEYTCILNLDVEVKLVKCVDRIISNSCVSVE